MPITPLDQWPDPNNFTTFTQKYAQNMALIEAFVNGLEGTVEGKEGALATDRKRKITISTSSPSGGSDGDIWIKI